MVGHSRRPDIYIDKGVQEAKVRDALRGHKHKKKIDPDYRKIAILISIVIGVIIVLILLS